MRISSCFQGAEVDKGTDVDKISFFYANAAAAGFSPFDFTVVLQRRGISTASVPTGPGPAPGQMQTIILERLDVVFPPSQMKLFLAQALETLATYESQFGRIRLEPADQTLFDSSVTKALAVLKGS
jgi:Protein of unknown function (DUF3467)